MLSNISTSERCNSCLLVMIAEGHADYAISMLNPVVLAITNSERRSKTCTS